MTRIQTIDDILALPKFGNGLCFARLQKLLHPLFDSAWGQNFTAIKITGSNGKGSTTALLHAMLRASGRIAGRFISPHLLRFHERIVLGDREVTDDELTEAMAWLNSRIDDYSQFGSFEIITALCVRCFQRANIDVGVMEAGIGGRYDPVRLMPGNLSALTSVDLEHTSLLGGTRELIACDKMDAVPDGGTVVSVNRDPDLWERMRAYARVRKLTLIDALERCPVSIRGDDMNRGMPIRIGKHDAVTPLAGTFQLDNIAIAFSLARELGVNETAMISGLASVSWPGRFERIGEKIYIDVGHTPDAIARLAETVKRFLKDRPILLVTGVSKDKDVVGIVSGLLPLASAVIATRAYHKGESVSRIAEIVRDLRPDLPVQEADTIERAAELARSTDMTVLVAGGLFLAVEFREAWFGRDPKALRFY